MGGKMRVRRGATKSHHFERSEKSLLVAALEHLKNKIFKTQTTHCVGFIISD
jgi:hypothetical protein